MVAAYRSSNGETGIRTLGTLSGTRHFECRTFNRSDISPYSSLLLKKGADEALASLGGDGAADSYLMGKARKLDEVHL